MTTTYGHSWSASVRKFWRSMQTSASTTRAHLNFMAMFLVKLASNQVKQNWKPSSKNPANSNECIRIDKSSGHEELLWCSLHPQLCRTDSRSETPHKEDNTVVVDRKTWCSSSHYKGTTEQSDNTRVPGEIKRSRDLRGGRWSWTLKLAQKRSWAGRWSWAEKVGLLLIWVVQVVHQQQCNEHCLCDCPSTAVETAVAQCRSRWAMARGHRLNTSIVLAAVHGLSGLSPC